ncbi:membrane hypothetical protein [Cupriavidus taiwanensis]|nr:membrane hypothetical protein [Cupriavidus taiwanensis]
MILEAAISSARPSLLLHAAIIMVSAARITVINVVRFSFIPFPSFTVLSYVHALLTYALFRGFHRIAGLIAVLPATFPSSTFHMASDHCVMQSLRLSPLATRLQVSASSGNR